MTPLPPFRLGLLFKPSYILPRLRELRSPRAAVGRLWDLARYLGFRAQDVFYAARGGCLRLTARLSRAWYFLRGVPLRAGAAAARGWSALEAALFRLRGRARLFLAAVMDDVRYAAGATAARLAKPVCFVFDLRSDMALARLMSGFKPSRRPDPVPNPPSPARGNPPAAVQLSWNIHAACNYDCPYCWFHGHWDDFSGGNVYLPPGEWAGHWDRFNDRCGGAEIYIAGGEPFVYPGFEQIVARLSKRNVVFVITNLAWAPASVIGKLDPAKVAFSASFHHQAAGSADAFAEKVASLRRAGFHAGASIVAYPPFLRQLPDWVDAFMARGIYPVVQPFRGEWRGRAYPAAYSRQGRRLVEWLARGEFVGKYGPLAWRAAGGGRTDTERKTDDFAREYQLAPRVTRGALCNAGRSYGRLQFNGDMIRCSQGGYVGKFFDRDFNMGAGAQACPFRFCECGNEVVYVKGGPLGPG